MNKWLEDDVLALLRAVRKVDVFDLKYGDAGPAWDEIAKQIHRESFVPSGLRCRQKLSNVLGRYEAARDKQRSGYESSTVESEFNTICDWLLERRAAAEAADHAEKTKRAVGAIEDIESGNAILHAACGERSVRRKKSSTSGPAGNGPESPGTDVEPSAHQPEAQHASPSPPAQSTTGRPDRPMTSARQAKQEVLLSVCFAVWPSVIVHLLTQCSSPHICRPFKRVATFSTKLELLWRPSPREGRSSHERSLAWKHLKTGSTGATVVWRVSLATWRRFYSFFVLASEDNKWKW